MRVVVLTFAPDFETRSASFYNRNRMKIEQLYTKCLAEAAYYIESNGEAAIIDPLREVDQYIEMAAERNAKIKYVFETHFHADFVSGHVDLAQKTGAQIVYGPTAKPGFEAYIAKDGEELALGNVTIKVLHTPGHTMESSTYLLLDEENNPTSMFTGDTLFIGDVGRPDLAVKSDLTQEDLAGHMFDSLRNKIMTLPDHVIVYPNHGQGSACGKNMSSETYDTLGNQKKTNYALRADMTKEEFIQEVVTGLTAPPQYFPKNAVLNMKGYMSFDDVKANGLRALSVEDFQNAMQTPECIVLDTRKETVFTKGFIPNSIFIGIDGNFAPWVGVIIEKLDTPILLIADEGREEEVVTRLARVGYDNPMGYLKGGFEAWKQAGLEVDTIEDIDAAELANQMNTSEGMTVLDVRKVSEFDKCHINGAVNHPLDYMLNTISSLDKGTTYKIHCAGGYRSVSASSLMKRAGINNVTNVLGGFGAIKESNQFDILEAVEA